ncbi:MAG: HEPN domain-containing protein [Deltaproteobacteria bacterium]|nr:HEPN domain-containing protein [Deltaproteobacteria bacterium]
MKDEASWFLRKAERALRAAHTLLATDDPETAVGRAYYCMLHAAQALLREQDIRFRKHSSVHGAFGQHFAKTGLIDPRFHRWLLDSYDDRIRGDYDTEAVIGKESAELRIKQATEFLQNARQWLEANGK